MSTVAKLLVICSLLMAFVYHPDTHGQQRIYKFVDKNGQVSFTDRPVHDGYVRLKKTWKGWVDPGNNFHYRRNKKKYRDLIVEASKKHQVPVWLISAVIHAESLYNPHAVSSAGAVGLMQLMPATARNYGVYDRQDPKQNINGGVRYLRDLLDQFDGNLKLALAAYNAGEYAVKKYGNQVPPYQETQNYVSKVTDLGQKYKARAI